MTNTAAEVRQKGIEKSGKLAEIFGQDWILEDYLPVVIEEYKKDKRGYNYRMCCLSSLAAVAPFLSKDKISQQIVPIFLMAVKDDVPNVRFCVCRIIHQTRQYIDFNVFNNQLVGPLKDLTTDSDKDVIYFANLALEGV